MGHPVVALAVIKHLANASASRSMNLACSSHPACSRLESEASYAGPRSRVTAKYLTTYVPEGDPRGRRKA